ncbi:MAG: HEPN domain-containing protein [Defluviitaleaceae bacterium]|nr:HEPN domain-containing protein [Defluviitaleaceae bacterium]
MKKAHSNLESAQMLFENGMHDGAVSSSYYAVFHAVSALLASKGMEFSKHKTVINKFNEEFIYPGVISEVSFRSLTALFRLRMDCEYDPISFIGEEGAKEAIKLAQAGVNEIYDYCLKNNIIF